MSFSDINIQGKFEPLARTPWVTLSLGWTIKCIIFYCMITHPGEVIILHFINLNCLLQAERIKPIGTT